MADCVCGSLRLGYQRRLDLRVGAFSRRRAINEEKK